MIPQLISVIIPVRNREPIAVERCIKSIRDNCLGLIKEIIVVDYNSTVNFNFEGAEIIRVNDVKYWNKAHALNIGIQKTLSPFIMVVDCDILFSEKHFIQIANNLSEDNFIIDTNVRRIQIEQFSTDYETMIELSNPWYEDNMGQLINYVNGGFQVFPRKLYEEIRGLSESIGLWWGGLDNWLYFMARMRDYTIIDISYTLLHQEHIHMKEDNNLYGDKVKETATKYREWKARWLDKMIKDKLKQNPDRYCGKEQPCTDLLNQFLHEEAGLNGI